MKIAGIAIIWPSYACALAGTSLGYGIRVVRASFSGKITFFSRVKKAVTTSRPRKNTVPISITDIGGNTLTINRGIGRTRRMRISRVAIAMRIAARAIWTPAVVRICASFYACAIAGTSVICGSRAISAPPFGKITVFSGINKAVTAIAVCLTYA